MVRVHRNNECISGDMTMKIKMTTKQVNVQRVSVISSKSFEEVLAGLEATVGHPKMDGFFREVFLSKDLRGIRKNH